MRTERGSWGTCIRQMRKLKLDWYTVRPGWGGGGVGGGAGGGGGGQNRSWSAIKEIKANEDLNSIADVS